MNDKQNLVVIVGPTAVGKTNLSIQLAKRIRAEIISADSRSFYRGMDIGTAKPSIIERQKVRHHLIDILDPDESMNLALFLDLADASIRDVHARKKLPILVGGTGQFISALIHGWRPPKGEPDPSLRAELNEIAAMTGKRFLHQWLMKVDPQAAEIIDASNIRRTIRAIEVILSSGEKFSRQRRKVESPYNSIIIGIHRSRVELYERVDQRIYEMIQNGFEHEVRNLLDTDYSPTLPAFSAIGYREMAAFIEQRITLDEAVAEIKRKSRKFIRRQANWFKLEDSEIQWHAWDEDLLDDVEAVIRKEFCM